MTSLLTRIALMIFAVVECSAAGGEFFGDTCVEQTVFAIRGEPAGDGQPFVFRGRALVVYVRSAESPTGWASLREIIQPAAE